MTFAEFIRWLAAPAALGIVSTFLVDLIKFIKPEIVDKVAVLVSVIVAGVASFLAQKLIPSLSELPPIVESLWPIIVWAVQQFFYQMFNKDHSHKYDG